MWPEVFTCAIPVAWIVCYDPLQRFSILLVLLLFAMDTIIIITSILFVMVTCKSCFYSFSLQPSQLWLHILLFIVSHVRFYFFQFFLGATITILAACITHYCQLYRSFSLFYFLFLFFSYGYNYNHMNCFTMFACDLFIYCLNYNHIYFCYDFLQEAFFSPCCNNCSYACGHKYCVLGITDMSKVFFSNF
jgi:hypothetical protein